MIALIIVIMPISLAWDVGDRIPEIEAAREKDESLKEIEIRHPQFLLILLLTIASFWSVIGWIIAIFWACSPGTVHIPDKLFNAAFGNPEPPQPQLPSGTAAPALNVAPAVSAPTVANTPPLPGAAPPLPGAPATTPPPTTTPEPASSESAGSELEAELLEVKSLLEKGLINEEEAESRRKLILGR